MPILRRYDDPELVSVGLAFSEKPASINVAAFSGIEISARAIAIDTISLEIVEMRSERPCSAPATGAGNMDFDNNSAHSKARQ